MLFQVPIDEQNTTARNTLGRTAEAIPGWAWLMIAGLLVIAIVLILVISSPGYCVYWSVYVR